MQRIAKDEFYRYLPISERDRRWGLYVTGVGRIIRALRGSPDTGHPAPYYYTWETGRVLPEYGVLYITQGSGEFESERMGQRQVAAGMVVLLFPGVWHRYRPHGVRDWTYYWVHFGGSYVQTLVDEGLFSPDDPVLATGIDEALLHPYLSLIDRARSEPPGFQQLMAGNILEILGAALATSRRQPHPERFSEIARQATLMLEQRVEEPIDMKWVAASLALSYDRFRHIFREHTGQPPYQYFLQLRINRAKELLSGTDLPVKQIAAMLHFDDTYHFSRLFKQRVGAAPTEWRGNTQRPRPGP